MVHSCLPFDGSTHHKGVGHLPCGRKIRRLCSLRRDCLHPHRRDRGRRGHAQLSGRGRQHETARAGKHEPEGRGEESGAHDPERPRGLLAGIRHGDLSRGRKTADKGSVAGLPVLLRIGCDAQLACASRLSRFTLLGNDPTLRGLHPCISHRYLTVPFRGARRTNTVTGGLSRGMQRQAVRLLQR